MTKAKPNVPPNNIGASSGTPRKDFYVRENKDDVEFGPLTFAEADDHARFISELEDRSGLAEIITYVGDRAGDPIVKPPRAFVIAMFIRGKLTLKGRAAQYHSENGLPPTS